MTKPLILVGAGGHASVLAEVLNILQHSLVGFTDIRAADADSLLTGLNYLGDDASVLSSHAPTAIRLVNGLGSSGEITRRAMIFKYFTTEHYQFTNIIHPTAWLSPSAKHGQGLQMLAGAIVNAGATLGENVLINSRAIIEHHCKIDNHSHIASGAVICGDCHIGHSVHVGAGAVVNQGITIGDGAIIASGAVVITDVPAGSLVAGVPAQLKIRNKSHE
jgi:sugar O-acyltransferase (sialic acid O-acetyltransferase NeuD family)